VRRLILIALFLMSVPVLAQQPAPLGPNDAIGFDYSDVNMTTYQVVDFQAQFDSGAWVSLGIPTSVVLADTQAGHRTYKVLSPFANGTHSVVFRACNSAGCGGPSVPFAYAHVDSPSATPGNVRRVPR
jgi:hypothetical protein